MSAPIRRLFGPATEGTGPSREQERRDPRALPWPGRGRTPGPAIPDRVGPQLVSLLQPTSFAAERYRDLRHVVEHLRRTADVAVIAVSSPSIHDGKTTTTINLAGALAQVPAARILLVEGDLRRPTLAEYLGLRDIGGPGLTGLITNPGLALEDAARTLPPFNLDILPAGSIPPTPYDVLESPQLGELLEQARRRYDFIVFDTPPLLPVQDCRVLGKWVDGFLLVVAAHKTTRQQLTEAMTVIDPSRVLGLVFNGDDRAEPGYLAAYGRTEERRWWQRLLGRRSDQVRTAAR